MTSTSTIHLGFEVGTGTPVEIPLKHMAVTGQSQEAGKTTALEALISRSGVRAVTFITKRGEGSFQEGHRLPPFFRERADWPFVASLIDATLGEKNKLLRAWLMKVCRDTKTLAEVQANVRAAKATARGFSESIYTEIEGYLELVVPQLAQLPPARKVIIGPGLNVMDLSPYRAELQGLVIRSVIEHVYEHENDVVTVIPEAWEFLPEGRGSPVKLAAETLIRKGAALRNYMWIDSQDLGGVWKLVVRACPVVLVGVQRESNEIKRTLANIPAGVPKLTPADVATLELGQFFACWGRHAIRTYVRPAWMDEQEAQGIATGGVSVTRQRETQQPIVEEDDVTTEQAARLTRENERLAGENADLKRRIEALERADADRVGVRPAPPRAAPNVPTPTPPPGPRRDFITPPSSFDNEALYQAIKARLIREASDDPALLKILTARPELQVDVVRKVLTVDGAKTKGALGRLIAEGFFDQVRSANAAFEEMKRRGQNFGIATVYRIADELTTDGFLTKEAGGYQAVAGMKINIVEKDAAA